MKLHLGVDDVPEPEADGTSRTTTFAVAKSLEERYGLFSKFAADNMDGIMDALTKNYVASFESGAVDMEDRSAVFHDAGFTIRTMLRRYIATEALAGKAEGVPTKAALAGYQRLKGPNYTGPRRPSFIDSGTMYDTLRAWVE